MARARVKPILMSYPKTNILLQVSLIVLYLFIPPGCSEDIPVVQTEPLSITQLLQDKSNDGFKRAVRPVAFQFPRDHGAHHEFKNEWWYFTGNVEAEQNRRFGFQFTLFRTATGPERPVSRSKWATNQLYLAHIALTDKQQGKFHTAERFARGALDLAGVNTEPFKAWLEDWTIVENKECGECFNVNVRARAMKFGFELNLSNTRPLVKHGESGLSRKSNTPGNASYYYSYPRLQTKGRVHIGESSFAVAGDSWFDHEWSTSALEQDQTGWDWFSLQLSNDTELMLFKLRHRDDAARDFKYGSFIDPDGTVTILGHDDFTIYPDAYWESPATGTRYPSQWRIQVPRRATEITLYPLIANQEMNLSFRYWEGAVRLEGTHGNTAIAGRGYVELTGYQ